MTVIPVKMLDFCSDRHFENSPTCVFGHFRKAQGTSGISVVIAQIRFLVDVEDRGHVLLMLCIKR